jgi:hypothetical protein
MSEELVNNWKPRKENILRFATGNACVVQKPGPELAMKTAHLHRRLKALRQVSTGETPEEMTEEQQEEAGLDALEKMTADERAASYEIMCVTVAACVKRPRIYAHPKPGQVGVNDIDDEEFLAVWRWYQAGCPDIDEDEGVSAADADRFPAEQAAGVGVGDSGSDVRSEAVGVGADS